MAAVPVPPLDSGAFQKASGHLAATKRLFPVPEGPHSTQTPGPRARRSGGPGLLQLLAKGR